MLTVKVKFKIDDKVWCIHNNMVRDFIVKEVIIIIRGRETLIRYTNEERTENPSFNVKESACFATRAALIKSLS